MLHKLDFEKSFHIDTDESVQGMKELRIHDEGHNLPAGTFFHTAAPLFSVRHEHGCFSIIVITIRRRLFCVYVLFRFKFCIATSVINDFKP